MVECHGIVHADSDVDVAVCIDATENTAPVARGQARQPPRVHKQRGATISNILDETSDGHIVAHVSAGYVVNQDVPCLVKSCTHTACGFTPRPLIACV